MIIEAEVVERWRRDGLAVLPGFLTAEDIAPAVAALPAMFPTADGFHSETDERRERFVGDEFAGIDEFPFADVEVSLACVHPKLVALARALLGDDDLRVYGAEAWAKYAGAADYEQPMHRDFLGHTPLVPSDDLEFRQLEVFVFLSDVTEAHGPPHYVPRAEVREPSLLPNWRTRQEIPEVYDAEVSSAGPAGSVVAYSTATLHRGTALTAPGAARYTLHINFRRSTAEWASRRGWAYIAHRPAWYAFFERASVEQLQLFGFPRPGHRYWTEQTLAAMVERYPTFDPDAWRA